MHFNFQMEDLTCPTLLEVTSDYGSRDQSTEELKIVGFCTVYSHLHSKY